MTVFISLWADKRFKIFVLWIALNIPGRLSVPLINNCSRLKLANYALFIDYPCLRLKRQLLKNFALTENVPHNLLIPIKRVFPQRIKCFLRHFYYMSLKWVNYAPYIWPTAVTHVLTLYSENASFLRNLNYIVVIRIVE